MIATPIPEAATFADALDCLGAALLLVEETGRIVYANASAQALLHGRSVLRAADGRVIACEPNAAHALEAAVAKAAAGGADDGAGAIAVPLPARDGEHCIAHVLALAADAHRHAGPRAPNAASAALLVHKVALEMPSPPEVIAALYGLTPSELRVLLAIVEVGGVPETAETLGVAEATVKTHLHRLFGKTGATRQADLVKLVAGFANPVVGRCRPAQAAGSPGRSMRAETTEGLRPSWSRPPAAPSARRASWRRLCPSPTPERSPQ